MYSYRIALYLFANQGKEGGNMEQDNVKDLWTYIPKPDIFQKEHFQKGLTNDLLKNILSLIQDGITMIDKDLNVIYQNPTIDFWYPKSVNNRAGKCYSLFHKSKKSCDNCPVLKAFKSRKPETELVLYENICPEVKGWQRIYCMPILDDNHEVIVVIEYIRDITSLRKLEYSSQLMEKQNEVLFDFLEQKEKEMKTTEQTIAQNVELSMRPVLNYLETILAKENMDIVKKQLNFVTKRLSEKKSYLFELLSPKELQVAIMIRDNFLSKEIADKLMISKKTVDYHRTKIRKKIKLGPNVNLQQYLEQNLKY